MDNEKSQFRLIPFSCLLLVVSFSTNKAEGRGGEMRKNRIERPQMQEKES